MSGAGKPKDQRRIRRRTVGSPETGLADQLIRDCPPTRQGIPRDGIDEPGRQQPASGRQHVRGRRKINLVEVPRQPIGDGLWSVVGKSGKAVIVEVDADRIEPSERLHPPPATKHLLRNIGVGLVGVARTVSLEIGKRDGDLYPRFAVVLAVSAMRHRGHRAARGGSDRVQHRNVLIGGGEGCGFTHTRVSPH